MSEVAVDRCGIGERARQLYEERIRSQVEIPDNIGKMVVIDVETGEFGVDATGLETSQRIHEARPAARLFGIRIGYDVADAIGGLMERGAYCSDAEESSRLIT
jgi:hypothetical protein